jgi:hypothetical protein
MDEAGSSDMLTPSVTTHHTYLPPYITPQTLMLTLTTMRIRNLIKKGVIF